MIRCDSLILGAVIGAAAILALTKEKAVRPPYDPPFPPLPPCGCGEEKKRPKPPKCDCYYRLYERY